MSNVENISLPLARESIKDRCWATPITAAGVISAGIAAERISKGKLKHAAVFAGASALADWADGFAARRFAKRHPAQAAKRANRGALEDQLADKVRNALIAGTAAVYLKSELSLLKNALKAVAIREAIALVTAVGGAAKHKIDGHPGLPAAIPSSNIGKEVMWHIGGGVTAGVAAAALHDRDSTAAKPLETVATSLLAIGLARGIQTIPEYKQSYDEMMLLPVDERSSYKPMHYRPHVGTYVMQLIRPAEPQPEFTQPIIEQAA